MGRRRWRSGIGRFGTRRILDIGAGRRRSFRSSLIIRPMRGGGRCRGRKWGGRGLRGGGGKCLGGFWRHVRGGGSTARGGGVSGRGLFRLDTRVGVVVAAG